PGRAHWPARRSRATAQHAAHARRGEARRGGRGERSSTHLGELGTGEEGVDGLLALGMLVGVEACEVGRGGERAGQDRGRGGVLRGHARRGCRRRGQRGRVQGRRGAAGGARVVVAEGSR
ncbi:hypothetical protein FRC12_024305, partial [Ceratobasidium sp. 428]